VHRHECSWIHAGLEVGKKKCRYGTCPLFSLPFPLLLSFRPLLHSSLPSLLSAFPSQPLPLNLIRGTEEVPVGYGGAWPQNGFWCVLPRILQCVHRPTLLWSPYGIRQTIIFLPCGFSFLLSSFFLLLYSSFFPRLISAVADWMSTSTHGVALVRISDAGLERATRGSLKIQDAKKSSQIESPSGHHSSYIFSHCITTTRLVR